jgi:peptidyl-prolyl cis-trans isomerase C
MHMFRSRLLRDRALGRGAWVLLTVTIAVVAYGLGSCSKRQPETEHDKIVLARVAGKEFTAGDLERKIKYQFRSMSGSTGRAAVEQYRQIYMDAVEELCWIRLGEEKGYKKDPVYEATLELARRWVLKDRTIEHEVRSKEIPTEEEIKAYYEAHKSEFRMPTRVQAAHVLLKTQAEAQAIRRRLLAGEPVAELARRYSIDDITKNDGGMVGWITPTGGAGHLGNQTGFNDAAMRLRRGDIGEPVQIPSGWSVIVALDRTEEQTRPLDAPLQEAIQKRAQTEKHNRIYADLMTRMKKEYGVETYDDAYEKFALSLLSEDELFASAQKEKDPKRRAVAYEDIARRFPSSTRAAQAQFMYAFTLADDLKEYAKAREEFEKFLKTFPANDLSDSARWMIQNMERNDIDPTRVDGLRRQALGVPSPSGS